jgi:hypothetical protein
VIWSSSSSFIISIVGKQKAASISHLQRLVIKNNLPPFVICNIFRKKCSSQLSTFNRSFFFRVRHFTWPILIRDTQKTCFGNVFDCRLSTPIPSSG